MYSRSLLSRAPFGARSDVVQRRSDVVRTSFSMRSAPKDAPLSTRVSSDFKGLQQSFAKKRRERRYRRLGGSPGSLSGSGQAESRVLRPLTPDYDRIRIFAMNCRSSSDHKKAGRPASGLPAGGPPLSRRLASPAPPGDFRGFRCHFTQSPSLTPARERAIPRPVESAALRTLSQRYSDATQRYSDATAITFFRPINALATPTLHIEVLAGASP